MRDFLHIWKQHSRQKVSWKSWVQKDWIRRRHSRRWNTWTSLRFKFSIKHWNAPYSSIFLLRLSQNVYMHVYAILRFGIHKSESGHIVSPCNATTVRHIFRRLRICLKKKIETWKRKDAWTSGKPLFYKIFTWNLFETMAYSKNRNFALITRDALEISNSPCSLEIVSVVTVTECSRIRNISEASQLHKNESFYEIKTV